MDPEKDPEKQSSLSKESGASGRDIQRRTDAIVRSQHQHEAEVQARRSLHRQRRSLQDPEKNASLEKQASPSSPPLPSPIPKESVEIPDLRFSMASDTSEAPEREFSGIASNLDVDRPPPSRGESTRTGMTGRSLPELTRSETKLAQKEAHPWQHLGITLGGPMIVLFDITVPCIIYYTWYNSHHSDWIRECQTQYPNQTPCPIPFSDLNKDILGYAIICFGFGELWILIARVHRLFFHREDCAPLLSRNRWELDATSWVYGVAMILALIPFTVGSTLVLPHLYLYSPTFIMGFLGLLMFITTFMPFKIPIGINSHAAGSGLRPFIYYAAEDFIAVDGLQDREFRIRYNERYETNKMFRQFFFNLTLWWMLGVCVYIGAVSAVIWLVPFHVAFGLSFGVLFSYIAVWAGVSFVWVKYEMKREHRAYEEGSVDA